MQLDKAAIDQILTIVQMLAKGADDHRLSPVQKNSLNQNVAALINTTRKTSFASFSRG